MVGLGFLWGLQLPVIKMLWTSSYVLVAGGYSCMLLGTFFLIIDVLGFETWARPFVWIGCNALAIYMTRGIIDYLALAKRFAGGDIHDFFGNYGDLVVNLVALALILWTAWYYQKKKIILRI